MLTNYFIVALRNLRRYWGYTLINGAGLAIGMACCLLIALYLRHEMSYDRFHEQAERIYRVVQGGEEGLNANTVFPLGPAIEAAFPEVEETVRLRRHTGVVVQEGQEQFVEDRLYFADSSLFEVFTFDLVRGNPAQALTEPHTVLLTERTAHKYFGEADPLGQVMTASIGAEGAYVPLTVTGVLRDVPDAAHLHFDLLVSFDTQADRSEDWGQYTDLYTYVLLAGDAAPKEVERKIEIFINERHHPDQAHRYALQPLTAIHLDGEIGAEPEPQGAWAYVYLLAGIAVLILLIACFNFMNLATARASQRGREVGVRKAVGARRSQLLAQFMGEALVLGTLAMLLAVGLARTLLPLFNSLAGTTLQPVDLLDGYTVAVILGLILVVGVGAGCYPALLLAALRPVEVLKGRKASARHATLRQGLVVFQFAASIVLMVSTGFVMHQLQYMRTRQLGFNKEQIVVLPLRGDALRQAETLKQEAAQIPGVQRTALSERVPTSEGQFVALFTQEGAEEPLALPVYFVDADFLATYEVALLAGRAFSAEQPSDAMQARILNEAAMRRLGWHTPEEAVGKSLDLWGIPGHVVGVVQDFHTHSLREQITPLVLSMGPVPGENYLSVRARPEAAAEVLTGLEAAFGRIAPGVSFDYAFLDQRFAELHRADLRLGRIFGTCASLAILIACIGLFGLAAFAAEQRTKEIGVRKVLGASVPNLVALLTKDFLLLVAVAFIVAVPLAYLAAERWLDGFAYRIDVHPAIFAAAGLLALVIACVTVSYQALRTALADPVESLRYE